jgi:hypothetical protein
MNDVEARIHTTLLAMLPAASNSYRQAVVDLRSERFSYRGPASDLREALREVLDHMAPDAAVMSAQGFKLEANRAGPTMAQKARFILRQRDTSESVAKPALEATALVDTMTAGMVRSTYTSGAANVHVSPTRAEVQQLKLHVDSALARLLGIFG